MKEGMKKARLMEEVMIVPGVSQDDDYGEERRNEEGPSNTNLVRRIISKFVGGFEFGLTNPA